MFKAIFLKSMATSAAVGSALAMSLVANPSVVTTAPEIRNVACPVGAYPGDVDTTTELTLSRAAGQYGMFNRATATVTGGDSAVTGRVRFVLYNGAGNVVTRQVVNLDASGSASLSLPRYLRARQTYTVTAEYLGEGCFAASEAESTFYTVFARRTSTQVDAPNRKVGRKPVVSLSVRSGAPTAVVGRAKVVITKNGKTVASARGSLSGGSARVVVSRLRPGRYKASVRFLGSNNFSASSGADYFRVRR